MPDVPTGAELQDVSAGTENVMTLPDNPTWATNLPDIPTEVIEVQNLPAFKDDHGYINVVSAGGVLSSFVICTSGFNTVKTKLTSFTKVALTGPKGCGISLLCAVMYLLFRGVVDCLYLTPRSFVYSDNVRDYFRTFANKLQHQDTELHSALGSEEKFSSSVPTLIKAYANGLAEDQPLFLFVDLSFYAGHNKDSVTSLLDILLEHFHIKKVCMILSLSSSANNLSSNVDKINSVKFESILKKFQIVTVRDFTEGEARTYATKMHKTIKYDEIKHFCGTNPYLLSFLENATDIDVYQSTVESKILKFLEDNLDLKQEPHSLSEYIVRNGIGTCIKFARYANNGAALNRSEMQSYYDTWLFKNNLILEDEAVDAEQDEAQGDEDEAQGDQAEQKIQQQEGHEVGTKTLRWSFPTFGRVFLELIDNFINKSTEEMVQSVCLKERSFAGYWKIFSTSQGVTIRC